MCHICGDGVEGGVRGRGKGQKGLWEMGSRSTAWNKCGGNFASLHKGIPLLSKGLLFLLNYHTCVDN